MEEDTAHIMKLLMEHRNISSTSSLSGSLSRNSLLEDSLDQSSTKKRKFDETLSGAKIKSDNSYCESPWEFRRLKADLLDSKNLVIKLESRIEQLHMKSKENVILFDQEKNEMKRQLDSNRNTIKDLEQRLNTVRKRESECKEEIVKLKTSFHVKKIEHRERERKLESENVTLKQKVGELEAGVGGTITKLKQEVEEAMQRLKFYQMELEKQTKLCSNLEGKVEVLLKDQKDVQELKLQLNIAENKIKDLEYEKNEAEETRTMLNNLQPKVLHLQEIEKELNEKKEECINLREAIGNKLYLEEKAHDLQVKLEAVEDKEKELVILKTENTKLKQDIEEWSNLSKCFIDEVNTSKLKIYIEELRRKELNNTLELKTLSSSLSTTQKSATSHTEEVQSLNEENRKLQDLTRRSMQEIQILKKKVILVTRERDSYREQLDLYEKDLTLTHIDPESPMKEMCTQQKSRIESMEETLEGYRNQLALLEKQSSLAQQKSRDLIDQSKKIIELEREIKKLNEQVVELQGANDVLNERLEEELVLKKTKILGLKVNPTNTAFAKREEDFEKLKTENDNLKVRVKLLEEGEQLNLTQKVADTVDACSSKTIQDLQEQLSSANKKMLRLKEVFKKTSQDFRDVCYMLLGYKIDFLPGKMYKLSSMYSDSPEQHLMFQQGDDSGMEMLATPFLDNLKELVEERLQKQNSIPAFLSALTLSLLQQSDSEDDEEEEEEQGDEEAEDEQEAVQEEQEEEQVAQDSDSDVQEID